MKKFAKGLLAAVLAAGMMSQNAFAFTNGEWLSINTFEDRKTYNVDRGEVSRYLVGLYENFGGVQVEIDKNDFHDINNETHPYAMQSYYLGIIKAYGLGEFAPQAAMTYDEFSCDIYRIVTKFYPEIAEEYAEMEEKQAAKEFVVSRGLIPSGKAGSKNKVTLGDAAEIIDKTKNAAPDFEIKVTGQTFNYDVPDGPKAYLTFDDNCSNLTPLILDTLKEYDAKATFFVAGFGDPDVIRRMADEGHTVAVHTYTHDYSQIYRSSEAFWADIKIESDYLTDILGYTPKLLRFPGGSNNTVSRRYGGAGLMSRLRGECADHGYIYFDWNNDSGDANGKKYSPSEIAGNVLYSTKGRENVVVLMHQTAPKVSTYNALPQIIQGLRDQGYTLLPLTDATPPVQFD